ncbi:hypothetical protein ACFQQB_49925 [Nonomuraea rubra]|uniref:hypothetical protein n=1 Tax=Nonomuraea rubra TaxID=46180 RepID=UPI003622B4A7
MRGQDGRAQHRRGQPARLPGRGHRRRARRPAPVPVERQPHVRLHQRALQALQRHGDRRRAYPRAQHPVDPAGHGGSGGFAQRRAELLRQQRRQQQRGRRDEPATRSQQAERDGAQRPQHRRARHEHRERRHPPRSGQRQQPHQFNATTSV